MAEYPLLIFPQPEQAGRARRPPAFGSLRLPNANQQYQRLTPQFQRLQQAMEQRRLALQDNPFGIQPEQVLVIETIGSIKDFIKAVKRIKGLEWLGEFELDDISPDHGFEDETNPTKQLKGQLFLIMTDQRALREIQRLFDQWQDDHNKPFPRGLASLKEAFVHLHTIRPWGAEDRIRDTGILEDWENRIEHGQDIVPFEVELWFRENPNYRERLEADLGRIIESLDGRIVQRCIIRQIAYHGILGNIPARVLPELFSEIVEQQHFQLLQCESIMYLRPIGQCAIRVPEDMSETEPVEEERESELPQGEPVVALLDGLPMTGHIRLNGRLIVDDPDGFESDYQANERIHGTAMSSLICHGDLNAGGPSLGRPIYVRPIMKPHPGFYGQSLERIPEETLLVDLIHRAVRRLYEDEENEAPVAPSVRIINLSVCDPRRPFDRGMSAWARLLDWLSWEHNTLFIVSAGNHLRDIELSIPRTDLQNLTVEKSERAVIKAIANDTRHRRLLSPAETLNGLTIGATHEDASQNQGTPNRIDPFIQAGRPSTYNAHGPGYRRSIKPDFLLPGGKQLFSEKPGNTHSNATLQATFFNTPPGQCVATPGKQLRELDRTCYTIGTSNATALASRGAGLLYEVINHLRAQYGGAYLSTEYDVVLLKALLAHGSDWADNKSLYESILKNSRNSGVFKEYVGKFFGYGPANISKVIACTDQRVTVLGVGKLDDGEGHVFSFPLPPSLSAVAERRRLIITLAWLTPVKSKNQKYRVAHLWYQPLQDNKLDLSRMDSDWRATQRGTLQHEVLEGHSAVDFQDGESIAIKINCRAEGGDILEPIRYGLAVTLEVSEDLDIPIYQEVRTRLRARVPV